MPFPIALPMGFTHEQLNALLLTCSREKVADITMQSGDYIWARHNRTYIRITDRHLQDIEVEMIVGWLYANVGTAELLAGNALDFRAKANESRDEIKYFRANAVRARVRNVDNGVQITLRTIPEHPPTLVQLGIEQEIVDNLFPRYGLILIVGTTGSGKSTLLASGNRWRLEERRHDPVKIITFEDPIEYTYAGLADGHMPEPAQTEVGRGHHLTDFERAGPNAMRRAADVIVMGEMRDTASVDTGFEMAMTGHSTYSTLHVDTPAEAVDRIISFYPFGAQASTANKLLSVLRLVVAQKLARRKDGGVIAFRAWMVFDQEVRRKLAVIPFSDWAGFIREACRVRKTDFESQVKQAYSAGLITFETAREVASLTVQEARELLNVEGEVNG
ncbi:MAG: type II/IV secretion system family protein 3 [Hyphomicrobium sp.]|nr:MAG: type II/IV secretion system family protein 3 [Hyphomicrobium sp.]